jgi:hypothetical protein
MLDLMERPQDQEAPAGPQQSEDGGLDLDKTLAKLQRFGKAIDAHWGDWLKEARECYDFVAGRQLPSTEADRMKGEGKIPVAFNRMGSVIDAVSGAEILGRQEVKYSPRTQGDVQVNEIITAAAEWVRDECDAAGEESEAYKDCFISGLGYTETRTEYEENPKGQIIIECGEAMKCLPDPQARKPNAVDKRYLRFRNQMSLDEFQEMYPDATAVTNADSSNKTSNNPRDDYDEDGERKSGDQVSVDLWQWYETERVYVAPSRDGLSTVEYPEELFKQLQEAADDAGRGAIPHTTRKTRVYYEAVLSGTEWLQEPIKLPHGKFRFNFVTGKRDKTKGVWYGLARPMRDPQKWANAFFSMVLHILRTNAKGGLMMERGADGGESEDPIRDQKAFEETYAKSDEVTWVAPGALSSGAIKPKPAPQIPAAFGALMEQAISAIRETSGVSQELMGLVETNQPGVLEHQRKQASFGMLASFFDSFRRYRKFQGQLLLRMLRDLPRDTLVRIVTEEDVERYVPIAEGFRTNDDVENYDVIVDDAPAGPNQKDKTWSLLMQILPAVKEMMTPEIWLEVLRYSPLPESFVNKLREVLSKPGEPDEKAQVMERLQLGLLNVKGQKEAATVRKITAEAQDTEVQTQIAAMNPDPRPQVVA